MNKYTRLMQAPMSVLLVVSILTTTFYQPLSTHAQESPAETSSQAVELPSDEPSGPVNSNANAGNNSVNAVDQANEAVKKELPDNAKIPSDEEPPEDDPPIAELGGGNPPYEEERITVDTQIEVNVDEPTGSMSISFPIKVPPGRNGVQPNLSINYNSRRQNFGNIVGYGWDFDIPYIERINREGSETLFDDYYFRSSLDGEIQRKESSTSTEDYGAEIENGAFNEYEFINHQWWRVTDKFGTVYTFGTSTNTRLDDPNDSSRIFRWMLENAEDVNGNYVSYEYSKDHGQIYPSRIRYTGHGTDSGVFDVTFTLESRSDISTSTASGFSVVSRYRTSEIQAKINDYWLYKYELDYGTGDNGVTSLLTSITETGRDEISGATLSLPATTFEYHIADGSWTEDNNYTIPQYFIDASNGDLALRIIDANGDGLPDLVESHQSGPAQNVYLNNGDGTGWATSTGWIIPTYFIDTSDGDLGVRIADVNGDGFADLVKSHQLGATKKVYINNGDNTGWAEDANYSIPEYFLDTSAGDLGVRMADVNGDGLTDIVRGYQSGDIKKVYLNNGDGTGWTEDAGFSLPHYFIDSSAGNLGMRFAEVNGDGFADLIRSHQSGSVQKVYINNGDNTGWAEDANYSVPEAFIDTSNGDLGVRIADMNGDGLDDIVRSVQGTSEKVYLNNGDGTGWTEDTDYVLPAWFLDTSGGDQGTRLTDIDGDNAVDFVRAHQSGAVKETHPKDGPKGGLLHKITSSAGALTTVTYKGGPEFTESGELLNPHLALGIDLVDSVSISNGFNTIATTTYSYGGGEYYYNNEFDREFAYFATTTRIDPLGFKTITNYHQGNATSTTLGENEDHIAKKGKPYRIAIYDDADNLYKSTINKWENYPLDYERNYVSLSRTTELTYDGDGDHKDKAETFTYNTSTGNLTGRFEWGEVTGSTDGSFTDSGSDNFGTTYTYAASSSLAIMGLPSRETVVNSASTTVKDTKFYYDNQSHGTVVKGNETMRELWKSDTTWIDIEKTFNSYGLVTQEKDPRDKTTDYTYDAYNVHAATSTNAKGQSTGFVRDYSSGAVKRTNDSNGLIFERTLDPLDRVTAVMQPDLGNPATLVTASAYTYTDTVGSRQVQKTRYLSSATSTDKRTYLDGLNRTIQERVEAEDANTYAVKDYVYNLNGQLQKESLPYFDTGSSRTSAITTTALFSVLDYDPLGRVTTIATAVGTTTNAYDQWRQSVTDPLSNVKHFTRDVYGNLTQVEEVNDGNTYTTTYAYNYLKNLTNITDDAGNDRDFTYDGLGRRTAAEDLHASGDATFGSWSYTYDDSGNLMSQTDPNSQTVNRTYDDLNRVLTEDYTGSAGTEVTYSYDGCIYGIGKLCGATTTDSGINYTYNALGGTASETNQIDGEDYTTSYSYDRAGNQILITYPDSSQVQNNYNSAGLLEAVSYKEAGASTFSDVVVDFDYSPLGQITYQLNGNGTETTNVYDASELYRLRSKTTTSSGCQACGGEEAPSGWTPDNRPEPETTSSEQQIEELILESVVEATGVQEEVQPQDTLSEDTASSTDVIEEESAEEIALDQPVENEPIDQPAVITEVSTTSQTTQSVQINQPVTVQNTLITDRLIKNEKDARAWRKYHTERVEYLKTRDDLPDHVLESALYAHDKFETYLLEKGYIKNEGAQVITPLISGIWNSFKSLTLNALAWVLPKTVYAYLFDKEDFEYCSSLPCTLDNDVSWGSVTPSIDSTSQVSGTYSLKEVVSGEGGGGMESVDYNTSEIWVQFEVYIPDPMTWGGSGYTGLLMMEDSSNASTIWLNLEDWGTPRLTVNGDVLSYTNTGIDLTEGAVNTIEMRVKISATAGDIDIWVDNTTEGSPDYDGSGSLNTGTDNVDDILTGMYYAPESGVSTTYFDEIVINNSFIGSANTKPSAPSSMQAEGQTNPTDITDSTPEFSAIYNDADAEDIASYYQIQVDNDSDFSSTYWDSTKTALASSTPEGNRIADVSYGGSALASSTTYYWRIRFWDDDDAQGAWSTDTATFSLAAASASSPSILQSIQYTYDAVGNITSIVDNSATGAGKAITYAYDDLYRLTSASTTAASSTPYMRTFAYDHIGNITYKSDQGAYGYYGDTGSLYANPHAVTDIASSTTLTYDNNGNLLTSGNASYTWNYRNQLTQAGGGQQYDIYDDLLASGWSDASWNSTITYDSTEEVYGGTNAIKAVYSAAFGGFEVDNSSGIDTTGYYYLSIAVHGGGTGGQTLYAYFLDSDSNALTPAVQIDTYTGSIPSDDWVVATIPLTDMLAASTTIKGLAIESETATTVYYDAIYLTEGAGSAIATYGYDYQGSRVSLASGQTTRYPNRLYNTTGATTTKHIFANGMMIATVEGTPTATSTQYIHTDHLSGSNVISDSNGDQVQVADYYPFGDLRLDVKAGAFDEQRKFTGHEYDEDVGLTYAGARYYNQTTGRWLSQDPVFIDLSLLSVQLEDPQSWNSYSYARNNPLILTDPTGEFWWYGYYDTTGYEVKPPWVFEGNGVYQKLGEIFGGHSRAVRKIRKHGSELDQRSAEYGLDPALARAITAEEQSHLTPDEVFGREQLFPGFGGGGVGLMQVSGPIGLQFGGYTKTELAWDTSKNIYSGVSYINNISTTLNTTDPAVIGTRYNGSPSYGQRIQARAGNPNYDKNILVDQLQKAVSTLSTLVQQLSALISK